VVAVVGPGLVAIAGDVGVHASRGGVAAVSIHEVNIGRVPPPQDPHRPGRPRD
jgi:hypothetical protein